MAEQNKTKELTLQEVKALVSEWGNLQLNAMPANHHFVAKITGPIVVEEKETKEIDPETNKPVIKTFRHVPVAYKHKDLEGQPEFKVMIGEACANRLENNPKYPDKSYVDKYAFFTKTKYGNTFPQFINPFENERELVNVDDMFVMKKTVAEPVAFELEESEKDIVNQILEDKEIPNGTVSAEGLIEVFKGANMELHHTRASKIIENLFLGK